MLIIVRRDTTQSSLFIILQVLRACFGCRPHPSSKVHKSVTTASGTAASSLQDGQAWSRWREVSAQNIRQLPETVVTVLCTDDECGWHPKHAERTCRIINRLLCAASCWTIINILSVYFETKPNSIFQISTVMILTIQACCVAGSTVPDVSKDHSIYILFMNRTNFILKDDTAL